MRIVGPIGVKKLAALSPIPVIMDIVFTATSMPLRTLFLKVQAGESKFQSIHLKNILLLYNLDYIDINHFLVKS